MPDGGITSAFATTHNNRHVHSSMDPSYSGDSNNDNSHPGNHEPMMNRNDNADEQNNNTSINDNARRDFFEEIRNGGGHWSQLLRQVILSPPPISRDHTGKGDEVQIAEDIQNENIPLQIAGGSENGQFTYIGDLNSDINGWIKVGYLQPGDIILDIQGQQVRHISVCSAPFYCAFSDAD